MYMPRSDTSTSHWQFCMPPSLTRATAIFTGQKVLYYTKPKERMY